MTKPKYTMYSPPQALSLVRLKFSNSQLASLSISREQLTESGDLTYAVQAANTLANIMQNVRLDLLVTRPLRETMK